jgi:hypothetical protein
MEGHCLWVSGHELGRILSFDTLDAIQRLQEKLRVWDAEDVCTYLFSLFLLNMGLRV